MILKFYKLEKVIKINLFFWWSRYFKKSTNRDSLNEKYINNTIYSELININLVFLPRTYIILRMKKTEMKKNMKKEY